MDDGKVNVMSRAMLGDLDEAFGQAERDHAIVVLRSARKDVFSAGFDLKLFAANDVKGSLDMVRSGAELALRVMSYPFPTIGVMEGTPSRWERFCFWAAMCASARMDHFAWASMRLRIGIAPPGFAIELARSRIHPAWLSRTVTMGEMFEPDAAVVAGFLDRAVPANEIERTLQDIVATLRGLHAPSHAQAKLRLRRAAMAAMREAIDQELTLAAYSSNAAGRAAVFLPAGKTVVAKG